MKNLIFVFIFATLCVTLNSCTTEETISTQPNNPQSNGAGVYIGNVRLVANFEQTEKKIPPIVWSDMSGTKVEIVGTTLYALTNKDGYFSISTVDSGMFTIRIIRSGYQAVEIDGQFNNGIDTSHLSYTLADTTGYAQNGRYDFIHLHEEPARGYVKNAIASGSEKIKFDTLWENNSIKEIRADSMYTLSAEIEFDVEHPFSYTRNFLPVGYYACITENSTFEQNNLPETVVPPFRNNDWENLGFLGNPQAVNMENGNRKYYVVSSKAENSSQFSIGTITTIVKQHGKNLFLHIVPIWSVYYSYVNNPLSGEPPTYQYTSKLVHGDVTSIPIQW